MAAISSRQELSNQGHAEPMTKYQFLITYAPPYQLMDWLHKVFEQKRAKGEAVPEVYEQWLARWRETLGHAESQLIEDLNSVKEMAC